MLFLLLFFLGVIFFWSNFAACFFKSNDEWKFTLSTNIFITNFTFYYLFTRSYFLFFYYNIWNIFFTDPNNKLFSFILIIIILLTSIYNDNLSLIFSNVTREFRPFQNGLRIWIPEKLRLLKWFRFSSRNTFFRQRWVSMEWQARRVVIFLSCCCHWFCGYKGFKCFNHKTW